MGLCLKSRSRNRKCVWNARLLIWSVTILLPLLLWFSFRMPVLKYLRKMFLYSPCCLWFAHLFSNIPVSTLSGRLNQCNYLLLFGIHKSVMRSTWAIQRHLYMRGSLVRFWLAYFLRNPKTMQYQCNFLQSPGSNLIYISLTERKVIKTGKWPGEWHSYEYWLTE